MSCKLLKSLWLVATLLFSTALAAQADFHFGQVSEADLKMEVLASDTSAEAYVLHHSNHIHFSLSGTPLMLMAENRRVKLLKRSSFDRADVELYYLPRTEKISGLKAAIHLPNGETIKLKGSDFIREDYSDDVKLIKFTFPQVTEGAIIEYTFRKSDENYTELPKFYFQEDIPVRHAEYKAEIPEYYRYVSLSNSHSGWDESSNEVTNDHVSGISMQVQRMHYVKKDMPAFRDQPYSNNLTDYLPQMYLQLQSVVYPNQAVQDVISNWESLAKDLEQMEWFGRKFNNQGDVKKPLEDIMPMLASATTEAQKAGIAYRYVGQHMNWDESYRIGGDNRLNVCWEKASGNSAEINMILLGVLRALQIEAQPLLVSTRNHGAPITTYPVFSQFNHLMVLATLEGQPVILDVGDPNRMMGLPRFNALNEFGWVADPKHPRWVQVQVPKMTQTTLSNISLGEDGMADVEIQSRMEGYYAVTGRNQMARMENDREDPIMTQVIKVFPDAEFVSRTVKETNSPYDPLSLTVNAKIPLAQSADDYLYISPVVVYALSKGLRDTEQRIAPVDMGYPWRERYIAKIDIPEGYMVEEMPEGQRLVSEDKSVSVTYSVATGDQGISLNYTVDLNKSVFSPEEYYSLKELFDRAIDLQEAIIVLRKVK